MSNRDNVQTTQNAYAAFSRGDVPAVLASLTDDVDWLIPGPADAIPYAGRRRGPAQVAKFFEALAAAEEVLAFEPREFVSEGDTVVACGNYRARVKTTGRTYEAEWVHVFHFRDGKVANFKEFFDTAVAVAAHAGAGVAATR